MHVYEAWRQPPWKYAWWRKMLSGQNQVNEKKQRKFNKYAPFALELVHAGLDLAHNFHVGVAADLVRVAQNFNLSRRLVHAALGDLGVQNRLNMLCD
jgi:hypothetical protein